MDRLTFADILDEERGRVFWEVNNCHGPGPGHPCGPGGGASAARKKKAAAAGTFGRDELDDSGGVRGTVKRSELARYIKARRKEVRSKTQTQPPDSSGAVSRLQVSGTGGAKSLAKDFAKHRGQQAGYFRQARATKGQDRFRRAQAKARIAPRNYNKSSTGYYS
jgi:hypothetical protein